MLTPPGNPETVATLPTITNFFSILQMTNSCQHFPEMQHILELTYKMNKT